MKKLFFVCTNWYQMVIYDGTFLDGTYQKSLNVFKLPWNLNSSSHSKDTVRLIKPDQIYFITPDRARKQRLGKTNMRARSKKNLETLLLVLELRLSFLMYFHRMFLQWGFCRLDIGWMSRIRCLSKITFILFKKHPSKGVHKNMLKVWNFTKNKLRQRCFGNNLHGTRHTSDGSFNGKEISRKVCCIHLQGHILDPVKPLSWTFFRE